MLKRVCSRAIILKIWVNVSIDNSGTQAQKEEVLTCSMRCCECTKLRNALLAEYRITPQALRHDSPFLVWNTVRLGPGKYSSKYLQAAPTMLGREPSCQKDLTVRRCLNMNV